MLEYVLIDCVPKKVWQKPSFFWCQMVPVYCSCFLMWPQAISTSLGICTIWTSLVIFALTVFFIPDVWLCYMSWRDPSSFIVLQPSKPEFWWQEWIRSTFRLSLLRIFHFIPTEISEEIQGAVVAVLYTQRINIPQDAPRRMKWWIFGYVRRWWHICSNGWLQKISLFNALDRVKVRLVNLWLGYNWFYSHLQRRWM